MKLTGQHSSIGPFAGALCATCQTPLAGQWCSVCGEKWASPDPTWHDFLHEATHEFLHLDGKIFCTIRMLFLEPGKLTAEYLRGRRVPYIGAVRLYLTMSLLFFVLSSIIPNPNPNSRQIEPVPDIPAGTDFASRVAAGGRIVKADPESFVSKLTVAFPKMMFALVPVFAILLRFVYRNRRRNYPAFLYFSLHFHAAVFGLLIFTLPLQSFVSDEWMTAAQGLVLVGSFVYLIIALKHVFGGRRLQTFLRASAVTGTYLVVFAAAIAILVVWLFYRLGSAGATH